MSMFKSIARKPTYPEPVSFAACPAKTFQRADGEIVPGRTVLNHCEIVGSVARALIERFPASLQPLFPAGSPLAAAAHDIGKVSPYFIEKILRSCSTDLPAIPRNPNIDPLLENAWGGHAGVSHVSAEAMGAPKHVPEILGQHHGFSPNVRSRASGDEQFGGPLWHNERVALVEALKASLGVDWPEIMSLPQSRLIAGLTTVSDWIGSGQFFEDPDLPWREQIDKALDSAGFVPPVYRKGLSFGEVFGNGFEPRPAQDALIDSISGPGLYVFEAPMGLGKTEAALYSAYRVLERGLATGVYFALPTQLTSNKIYERFNTFLANILEEGSHHKSLLLHGKAWLEVTDMGEEGRPGGEWFKQNKRGLLAPFSVGTIDQSLMSAMNVKHGFVRAFGLAGKVVILDEVHTYDAYTGTLMDAVIEMLRELKCTVIILSATLSQDRREKMIGHESTGAGYPLVTAVPDGQGATEVTIDPGKDQSVAIKLVKNDQDAFSEALDRAGQGQQVLWIENTVAEAQDRYREFAAKQEEYEIDCGLLHSRLTAGDRQAIEDVWVSLYGKSGWSSRAAKGRVLVGTQVLEQSLDIDADFLVSKFAPSDMLLQRLGRLWRHQETPRSQQAKQEAWFIVPDQKTASAEPEKAFGASAFVYSPYILCRSLDVWLNVRNINLPGDIRGVIEQTYVEKSEQGSMAQLLRDLNEGTRHRRGRKALSQLARLTLSESGNTLPESKAETRYSEGVTSEVLLVKGVASDSDKQATLVTLMNDEFVSIPWRRHALSKQEWKRLSVRLMREVVSAPEHQAPRPSLIKDLQQLGFQHCFYLGHPQAEESEIRVGVVDSFNVISTIGRAPANAKYDLQYRSDIGYQASKMESA